MNDNPDSRNSNAGYADEDSIELDHDLTHMLRSLPPIEPSVDFVRSIQTRIHNSAQQKINKSREVVSGDMPGGYTIGKIYSAIKTWTEDYTRPWVIGLALNGALLLSLTFFGDSTDKSLLSRATAHQTETYTDTTESEFDLSDTLLSYSDYNSAYNGDYNGEGNGIETIETFWEDYLPKEEV